MRLTIKKADAIIRAAKLQGFGGNCGRVAIAINNVVFDSTGQYVVATNPALNKKTGEFFFGHVVVEWQRQLFDATGLVHEDDVVGWGMLDYQDPDLPARLTERQALQGELHYIHDEFGDQRDQEDAIENFTSGRGQCPLRDSWGALERAKARVQWPNKQT